MKTRKTKHSHSKSQSVLSGNATGTAKRQCGGKQAAAVLDNLEQINLHDVGIDVGSAENFVCVPAGSVKPGQPNV